MNDLRIWVDDLLGRVTMYRLVVYGLLAIAFAALPLMFTDYLVYSPAAFVAAIIICVGASYLSNRLFGWMGGVRPHGESAVITGLILALLFTPPTTFSTGVALALVAVIANASKYLLTIRGRHVFNPAAIAIVIASVSGLAYATWWIATPALLLITIVVAGLILYKTQKLQMGLTFLATAVVMILLVAALRGGISPQDFGMVLTSWPLVFIAGIMLCEPLTLPPRYKQQLLVAIIVAVLMAQSFRYGSLSMTPALALVIGNIVGFWFGLRRSIKLRLVSTKKQGRDGMEFTFDVPRLQFLPGQYIELSLPHGRADSRGMRRVFSIIGHPGEHQLSVATRIPERPSTFKRALLALKPGQFVHGTRVAGDFVPPEDPSTPVLCMAGGVGITPYVSFLQSAGKRRVTILYAVKKLDDLMFVDVLRHYNVDVVVVSPDAGKLPDRDWKHEHGELTREIVERYIEPDMHVYISGPPAMVTKTKQVARDAGAIHIHTDHFTGY